MRIDLTDGGCCGTTYPFSLADANSETVADDARYGCSGAWLVVSEPAGSVLAGATLDYGANLKPPRFRIPEQPQPRGRLRLPAVVRQPLARPAAGHMPVIRADALGHRLRAPAGLAAPDRLDPRNPRLPE